MSPPNDEDLTEFWLPNEGMGRRKFHRCRDCGAWLPQHRFHIYCDMSEETAELLKGELVLGGT